MGRGTYMEFSKEMYFRYHLENLVKDTLGLEPSPRAFGGMRRVQGRREPHWRSRRAGRS